jgi:hypothetical protein
LSEWSKNYPTITPAAGEEKEFLIINLKKKKTITKRDIDLSSLMPHPGPLPRGEKP